MSGYVWRDPNRAPAVRPRPVVRRMPLLTAEALAAMPETQRADRRSSWSLIVRRLEEEHRGRYHDPNRRLLELVAAVR